MAEFLMLEETRRMGESGQESLRFKLSARLGGETAERGSVSAVVVLVSRVSTVIKLWLLDNLPRASADVVVVVVEVVLLVVPAAFTEVCSIIVVNEVDTCCCFFKCNPLEELTVLSSSVAVVWLSSVLTLRRRKYNGFVALEFVEFDMTR